MPSQKPPPSQAQPNRSPSPWVPTRSTAAAIALWYAAVGALWILCSGWLLHHLVHDNELEALLEAVKGWFYVAVTAAILSFVLNRYFAEIRRTVRALHTSESRLRLLGDNLPDGYLYQYQYDPDGRPRFTFISAGVERVHGLTPAAVLENAQALHGQIEPSLLPALAKAEARSQRGRTDFAMDISIRRSDGEVRQLHLRSRPREEDGQVIWDGMATDITERIRAEAVLRGSEVQFRQLVETAPEAIFIRHQERFTYLNRAALRLFGAERPEQLLGESVLERFHPDYRERIRERMKILDERGEFTTSAEQVFLRLDGSLIHVIVSAVPFVLSKKQSALVFARDISALKRSEQEITHQAALIKSLLDSIPDLIFFKDVAGKYLGCNPAFANFVGRPREAILQHTDHEFFPREVADEFRAHDRAMLETRSARQNEEWVTYPDGRRVLLDTLKTPFWGPNMELLGVLGISRDITERKRAEESLRESELRRGLALDAAQAGTWEWELATGHNTWSEELWRLYGLSPNSCAASYETWRQTMRPEDRPAVEQQLQEAVRQAAEINLEWRVNAPGGTARWLMSRGRPLLDTSGRVTRYVGVVIEITARKHAEEALRQRVELQDQLAKIAATVPGMIYSFQMRPDGSLCLPFSTPVIEELWGLRPEEVREDFAPAMARVHPEDARRIGERIAASARSLQPWRDTFRVRHPQKGERWLEGNSMPQLEPDGSILWHGFVQDITERKQAEAALRESEIKFRALIENAPDGIVLMNAQRQLTYASPAARRMFGFDDQSLLTLDPNAATHPDDLPQVRELIAGLLRDPQTVRSARYRFRHRNGEWIWIESFFSNLLALPGVNSVVINFRNIEESVQAEQASRASELKYRVVADNTFDWEFWLSPEGRFIYSSPSCERITGHKPEEFTADPELVHRIVHPDDRSIFASHQHAALGAHEPGEVEFRVVRPDGGVRWIAHVCAPIRDEEGRPLGVRGSNRDVTGRKQAEEAVRSAEEKYRSIFENASEGIFQSTPDGVLLNANPALARMYGFASSREMLSASAEVIRSLRVEPELREVYRRELEATGTVTDFEFQMRRQDGSFMWSSVNARAVRNPEGQLLFFEGTVRDITDRKAAEEAIRDLNRTLDQRVQERTTELRAANEELDAFTYAVSHDLRGPLRAMSGFSQALEEDFGAQLPPEAHEFLNHIKAGSQHMGELIDGLLKLSRATRGEVEREAVDLSGLIRRVVAKLEAAEPKREVAFSCASNLTVKGDAKLLELVLTNLLGNAWKYTAKTERPDIRVSSEVKAQEIIIHITDNGAGFDLKHAAKLFQPFQRLHREDEFPGLGIGLATVRRILRRHGGDIRATGAPGKGAIFSFSLPA